MKSHTNPWKWVGLSSKLFYQPRAPLCTNGAHPHEPSKASVCNSSSQNSWCAKTALIEMRSLVRSVFGEIFGHFTGGNPDSSIYNGIFIMNHPAIGVSPGIYRSSVLEKGDMREKTGWEETLSTSVSLTFQDVSNLWLANNGIQPAKVNMICPSRWLPVRFETVSIWLSSLYCPKLFNQHAGDLQPQLQVNFVWLVVSTHWKIWKSVGMMTFPIYGKVKFMFQTTNQGIFCIIAKAIIWWVSLNTTWPMTTWWDNSGYT